MAFPDTATLVPVTVRVAGLPGDQECVVWFDCQVWQNSSVHDAFIPPFRLTVTITGGEEGVLELPAGNDPDWTPQGWEYRVTLQWGNKFQRGSLMVPYDSEGLNLSDAIVLDGVATPGETYIPISQKGQPDGVATLDEDGELPFAQMPYHEHTIEQVDDLQTQLDSKQVAGTYLTPDDIDGLASMESVNEAIGISLMPYAPVSQLGICRPSDHGLAAWTFDPAIITQGPSLVPAAGTMHVVRFRAEGATCSAIGIHVGTPGSGLTNAYAALYTDAGALIAVTQDQSTAWAVGGPKTMPLVGGTKPLTPGAWYRVAFWWTGTTAPQLSRATSNNTVIINYNQTTPNLRVATANTGLTNTAPGTMGALTGANITWFVALHL